MRLIPFAVVANERRFHSVDFTCNTLASSSEGMLYGVISDTTRLFLSNILEYAVHLFLKLIRSYPKL